jgi:hypothetical protein
MLHIAGEESRRAWSGSCVMVVCDRMGDAQPLGTTALRPTVIYVRSIVTTCLLVSTALWLACVVDTGSFPQAGPDSDSSPSPQTWRYTKDGWERRDCWFAAEPEFDDRWLVRFVHPLNVALIELLIVAGVMTASVPANDFARWPAPRRIDKELGRNNLPSSFPPPFLSSAIPAVRGGREGKIEQVVSSQSTRARPS